MKRYLPRQLDSKDTGSPLLAFAIIISVFSLVLMLPPVRTALVSVTERIIIRRPLRDVGKWDRLILCYAAVQLLVSVTAAWLFHRLETIKRGIEDFKKELELSHVFLLLLVIAFIVQNGMQVVHPDRTGWYMDSTNLWDHYVCVLGGKSPHLGMYPPFAAFIYRFYASIVPHELLSGDWKLLAYSDAGSYVTLLYYLFSVVPFCILCYASVEGKNWEKLLATSACCLSAPFLYSLMRGNIVLFSCCAAFCFCRCVRSENGLVRLMGLFAIFIAIGTKLYPVAFAALLVKERRWKDIRLFLVLTLLLFITMLNFFDGGVSEIAGMVRNISNFTSDFKGHHNLSLKRQIWDILALFGHAKDTGLFPVLNVMAYVLYLAASAVLFFVTKKRWVELMLLSLACLLLPGIVRPYTEVFLVIPLIEMINDREKDLFLYFSLAFLLPMLLFICKVSVFITFHSSLITFPLFALCAAEVIHERQFVLWHTEFQGSSFSREKSGTE